MKNIFPVILLAISILLIGNSCNENNDDSQNKYSCDTEGLYYTVDDGQEVFLASTHDDVNTNFLENNNSFLMVHQLANGFLFQSRATTIGQTSTQDVNVSNGTSKLDIFSLWSNTDAVNINYTCQRNDAQINGTVYYTFTGNYTDSQNNTHTIEGYLCILLDEIRL